ncbi:DNA recombination protein RmuC [Paeniroseomonas aquatica]
MPEWILPVLVPVAAALAGMLVVLAFRPRGNDGVALLADRMDALSQRLDGAVAAQNERLARSLAESADRTQDSARRIHERLAVIDAARANIEALGTQVTTLSGILGNKQSRGAFGEVQLRDMLADRLPADGWAWQYTLASGVRCDALIRLPFPPGPIAIDSKFPLEAWQALRAAPDDAARALAQRRLATDIRRHVDDVATKYIRPGETAEGALIFLLRSAARRPACGAWRAGAGGRAPRCLPRLARHALGGAGGDARLDARRPAAGRGAAPPPRGLEAGGGDRPAGPPRRQPQAPLRRDAAGRAADRDHRAEDHRRRGADRGGGDGPALPDEGRRPVTATP